MRGSRQVQQAKRSDTACVCHRACTVVYFVYLLSSFPSFPLSRVRSTAFGRGEMVLLQFWLLPLSSFWVISAGAHAIHGQHNALHHHRSRALAPRALPIGTCNANTPCPNGACCGSNGLCGYSPAECGSGCASNCDAKAECGQYGKPGQQNCPLNVCCSKFGWANSHS